MNEQLRVMTWNTAKRLKHTFGQVELIHKFSPDIIALQEIIPSTEQKL
jgi:exonuclease III